MDDLETLATIDPQLAIDERRARQVEALLAAYDADEPRRIADEERTLNALADAEALLRQLREVLRRRPPAA
jgi:hypothetical protein